MFRKFELADFYEIGLDMRVTGLPTNEVTSSLGWMIFGEILLVVITEIVVNYHLKFGDSVGFMAISVIWGILILLSFLPYIFIKKNPKRFVRLCYLTGTYALFICISGITFIFLFMSFSYAEIRIYSVETIILSCLDHLAIVICVSTIWSFWNFRIALNLGYYKRKNEEEKTPVILNFNRWALGIFTLLGVFWCFSIALQSDYIITGIMVWIFCSSFMFVLLLFLQMLPLFYMKYYLRKTFPDSNWESHKGKYKVKERKITREIKKPSMIVKNRMVVFYTSAWKQAFFLIGCILSVLFLTVLIVDILDRITILLMRLSPVFQTLSFLQSEIGGIFSWICIMIGLWFLAKKLYDHYYLKEISVQETPDYFVVILPDKNYEIKKNHIKKIHTYNHKGDNGSEWVTDIKIVTPDNKYYINEMYAESNREFEKLIKRLELFSIDKEN